MTRIIYGDYKWNKELDGIKLMDMHIHSNLSDGSNSVNKIVSRARELNIGACITDHDEIKGSIMACKEILSLPATELTSFYTHDFLAYFNSERDANEFFEKNVYNKMEKRKIINLWRLKWTSAELIEKLKEYNCFIVIPHPFVRWPKDSYSFFSKDENKKLLKKIDAIEGVNSFLSHSRNRKAIEWAEKISKPVIGGSDCHTAGHIGNVVTGCFAETRTEFLEQMRAGKNYVVVKKEMHLFNRMAESIITIWNNIRL